MIKAYTDVAVSSASSQAAPVDNYVVGVELQPKKRSTEEVRPTFGDICSGAC